MVTPATAVELELDDLTSVREHCPDMAVGMPGNYADSDQGVKGLESYYDCKPKSAPELAEYSERVDALLNNEVQAAVLPESSPVIDDDDLKVLDDPTICTAPRSSWPWPQRTSQGKPSPRSTASPPVFAPRTWP